MTNNFQLDSDDKLLKFSLGCRIVEGNLLQQCSKTGPNACLFELWDTRWLTNGAVAKGHKLWTDCPTVIVEEDEVRTTDIEMTEVTDEATLSRLRKAGHPGRIFKLSAAESALLDKDFADL